MSKGLLLGICLLVLVLVPAFGPRPVLAATHHSPSPPPGRSEAPTVARHVNFASVAGRASAGNPAPHRFHPKDGQTFQAQRALAAQASSSAPQAVVAAGNPSSQNLSGFALMDKARQIASFGSAQNVQPPDTQVAAGPNQLVEAVNGTLSVWSESGALTQSSDLAVFFAIPTGFDAVDPRVLYDRESGRWIITAFALSRTNNNSQVDIAVSLTSDATGMWSTYSLTNAIGVEEDQPKTGVDSDKVVISWDDYSGPTPGTATFSGDETLVLQKSDLLAGATVHRFAFGPDTKRYSMVPAQSLTPTTTEWMAYDNADCTVLVCNAGGNTAGVVAITGTPAANNVTWTESDPAINATAVPPSPRQPGTTPVTSDIDDRFLSAVAENGTLWVSGNDSCKPAGDSTTRSCLRLVEVAIGASPTVQQDFDASQSGFDFYFAAVGLSSFGDLFVGFSESSSTVFPSAVGMASLASSPTTFGSVAMIAAGLASYSTTAINRWGDYSAAAQDPNFPGDVWLSAEYEASASDTSDWGTATARLAIEPGITAASPSAGPQAGGAAVTITGDHFQAGASVSFGANAATNVTVVNPMQITASTPAAAGPGAVDVHVTQPDGTAATATSAYTYLPPPAVTSIAPTSGEARGGASVTITGSNFTNVTGVGFGGAGAAFTVNSSTQITATSPPGSGSVDVTVATAQAGTSATSSADKFTYIPPTVPQSPTGVGAIAGDGQATISWSTPPYDGGASITGYRVTPYVGAAAQTPTTVGVVNRYLVTGLTDGVTYTFTVAAINSVGVGPESSPSAAATPMSPTFTSLGGVLSSGPGVASWSSQRLDVFVRGADNALWHRSWDGTTWTSWQSEGGVLLSDPATISIAPNRIDVFVRGADNALWYRTFDGTTSTWTPWTSLGGILSGGPEVSSWDSTNMVVFVRGADQALWKKTWSSGTWSGWQSLGGILSSDPSAVSAAPNTIDVLARGADNALWWNHYAGGAWSGWTSRGGILSSGPDAASCGSRTLDVFVAGADSAVWRQKFDGTNWGSWQSLGGTATADTSSVCRPNTNVVDTYLRGPDSALWMIATNGI